MNPRRGYELEGLFFGRPVRPFHLAVTLATGVVAYLLHQSGDPGWTGWATHALGTGGTVAVIFLTLGWWNRSDTLAEWGLLLAVGVWLSRASLVLLSDPGLFRAPVASFLLSVAWAVGAGGAYILERYDHVTRDD